MSDDQLLNNLSCYRNDLELLRQYKNQLLQFVQKNNLPNPAYASEFDGPPHCRRFKATVTIDGRGQYQCSEYYTTLKDAEHAAAKAALGSLITQLLRQCKNRLLEYAHKNKLPNPAYASEFNGPPHSRRFKATVTINGRGQYQCSEYYITLKDAEHAAAKVALDSLLANETEKSDGSFKSSLQELAQKHGYQIPSYSTKSFGQPHMAIFVSTIEVGGVYYKGEECTTKKRAEFGAAKVAYETLINRVASLQHTSRKTIDENREKVGAKRTADQEGCSSIVAARTDRRLSAPIPLIPDSSEAEGNEENVKRRKCSF